MAACASIAVMPAKAGIHDPIRKRTGCLAREIDPSLRWGDETGNDRFPPHAVPGDFDAYPNTRARDRSSIINCHSVPPCSAFDRKGVGVGQGGSGSVDLGGTALT